MDRCELAIAGNIGIARGASRGEAANRAAIVDRDSRHRLAGIRAAERVALRAIFGLQAIEVLVGKELAIRDLPRTHVHAGHIHSIGRFGGSQQHGASLA